MSDAARELETREDLVGWLRELLPDPYAYPATSGSTYGEDIRRFEWVARPLWAIFSLIASGEYDEKLVEPYIRRIKDGLDPTGPLAFPEPTLPTRQTVVEMEVFGYGLLVCGGDFLNMLSPAERDRLVEWLNLANGVDLPWGSWFCSRALVNAGLAVRGLPYDAERLVADLRSIESMYAGGGWYENGRPYQRDHYIGVTFHFVLLLLRRFAPELCPLPDEPARAASFEDDYVSWFDRQGRSVPFGRSVFYRFGHACFWAACALTGTHAHALEEVKRLLMQNLRWWRGHLTPAAAPLEPGYGYPNLALVENYCSPASPSRALRSFVVLALPTTDEFWSCGEVEPSRDELRPEPEPGVLAVSGPHHCYLLSAMQFGGPMLTGGMSRYGKLCYSSAFGWNVSRDVRGLANFAVDSCLALSAAGLDQFASRDRIDLGEVRPGYVHSLWRYGSAAQIETWLVPLNEATHARVHRIEASVALDTCEGSFPLFGWNPKRDVPEECRDGAVLVSRMSEAGRLWRSGIMDARACDDSLRQMLVGAGLADVMAEARWTPRTADVVLQDPNTNLYSYERSAVPVLSARIEPGTTWFACVVCGEPGLSDGR